jgi:hypothetical protein
MSVLTHIYNTLKVGDASVAAPPDFNKARSGVEASTDESHGQAAAASSLFKSIYTFILSIDR